MKSLDSIKKLGKELKEEELKSVNGGKKLGNAFLHDLGAFGQFAEGVGTNWQYFL